MGRKFVDAESTASVTAAVKAENPVANDSQNATVRYDVLNANMGVKLGSNFRISGACFKDFEQGHITGVLTEKSLHLEKLRLAQSLGPNSGVGESETLGTLTITHRADKDQKITSTTEFLILFHVWMWGHIAAGMAHVSPTPGRPLAGTKGPEGDLDGGRVSVTMGSMVQYQVFVYTVVSRGVDACLALHRNVMRMVAELVLHNDMNFSSALMSVLGSSTAEMLLHRGIEGFGLSDGSGRPSWTPTRKGSKGGDSVSLNSELRLEQQIQDLRGENKRLRERSAGRGGGGGGGRGCGGGGGGGNSGGGGGNSGGGGGDRNRRRRSRSRDREDRRRSRDRDDRRR